jgi:hypothetical protein
MKPRRLLLHGTLISVLTVGLPGPTSSRLGQDPLPSLSRVTSVRLPTYPKISQVANLDGTMGRVATEFSGRWSRSESQSSRSDEEEQDV